MPTPLGSGDAILDAQARHAHWLVRVPLALVMLYHGIDKWLTAGITGFAGAMALPWPLALLVVISEIAAGALLLAGPWLGDWFTRLGAALACPVLLGAIFMVHWGQWHFLPSPSHPMGGMEFQVTLLCLAIFLLIRGNRI